MNSKRSKDVCLEGVRIMKEKEKVVIFILYYIIISKNLPVEKSAKNCIGIVTKDNLQSLDKQWGRAQKGSQY